MAADDPGQARFEAMYQAYSGPVLGYVLRRTANPEDAADVVAETFLTLWRRITGYWAGDGMAGGLDELEGETLHWAEEILQDTMLAAWRGARR